MSLSSRPNSLGFCSRISSRIRCKSPIDTTPRPSKFLVSSVPPSSGFRILKSVVKYLSIFASASATFKSYASFLGRYSPRNLRMILLTSSKWASFLFCRLSADSPFFFLIPLGLYTQFFMLPSESVP